MRRVFSTVRNFLCFSALVGFSFSAHALDYEDYPVVKLRSLDKITARTMTFEAKVGSTVRFGEIFIKVQSCRKPPPVQKSDAAAFLQIWQTKDGAPETENSKWIFSGWMFASSPAVSAMDHPVYDVWVLDCLGRDPEPIPTTDENTGVKAPVTDGEAPDAVPPSVDPDKQKPAPEDTNGVSRDEDPGAFDEDAAPNPASAPTNEAAPEESVPATNMPQDAAPSPDYAPSHDAPDSYQDDTPSDDSTPKDDTGTATPVPAPVPSSTPNPTETPAGNPQKPQENEINGIY